MSVPDDASLRAEAAKALGATRIVRRLRDGGQKLVALVEYGGQDAVLKVVRVQKGTSGEVIKRAHREAGLIAGVNHPHVVRGLTPALDLGTPIYAICWLEEFLDGEDLRDLVGAPWRWRDAWKMARDVADGLEALHGQHVVHRDLSPGNVRRLTNGDFKILDPGYARHLDQSGVTGLGQPGTEGFLSPEHVQLGTQPSYASDVFTLGVLIWLVLVGDLPVSTADTFAYIDMLANQQVPSIATRRSGLPPDVVSVIDRCLERQVARRYFDGGEVRSALEAL
ncbi:MAG: hypothetical protein QOJ34_1121 [Pseudonocardiales bacterium]|jgi:serine/threonine-protein kinase|nr:hypothetical protein [Pseudonocardiales bacterium]